LPSFQTPRQDPYKDPKVLMKYDDDRKDVAGDIAGKIDLWRTDV
jgi:hypothetical protein